MKKLISIALAAVLALSLAACGNSDSLSGKVATDGSTSMEKVIGALKETFEGENKGVEVTYNPTGSSAGIIAENPTEGEYALDLLMIAKYFERIGDHFTNIAEWVEFSVTGTHQNCQ